MPRRSVRRYVLSNIHVFPAILTAFVTKQPGRRRFAPVAPAPFSHFIVRVLTRIKGTASRTQRGDQLLAGGYITSTKGQVSPCLRPIGHFFSNLERGTAKSLRTKQRERLFVRPARCAE